MKTNRKDVNMNSKRVATLLLAALMLGFSLASCGQSTEKVTDNNEAVPSVSHEEQVPENNDENQQNPISPEDTSADETEGADITEEPVEEKITGPVNKLTGTPTTEKLANQRPIAIMFNNLKAALPQHGISEMDVVYEAIVEGSITRLLGLVTDWETLPDIGSIRSSRDYYIDFCDAHNGIYVHAGGSDIAYQTLWQRGTDNIDGTNGAYSSASFYRNQERRKKGVSLEHTLFSSGELLSKAVTGLKYTTTLKDGFVSPFRFSAEQVVLDGQDANYVYIPFSTYAQSYFDYNTETGVYDKGQYVSSKSSLDKHNSPHIDGNNNKQLAFENIVIICTSYRTIDNKGRQAVDFTGNGKGYYFTDGKCKEIKWSRPTRTGGYTLYETDGNTELLMNVGKTYVGVIKNGTEIIYK